jgi:hypothetical protein
MVNPTSSASAYCRPCNLDGRYCSFFCQTAAEPQSASVSSGRMTFHEQCINPTWQ